MPIHLWDSLTFAKIGDRIIILMLEIQTKKEVVSFDLKCVYTVFPFFFLEKPMSSRKITLLLILKASWCTYKVSQLIFINVVLLNICDHLINSNNLFSCFGNSIARRNLTLITKGTWIAWIETAGVFFFLNKSNRLTFQGRYVCVAQIYNMWIFCTFYHWESTWHQVLS